MTNARRPLRLNIGFIIHAEVGYKYEFPFEFEKFRVGDDLELTNFGGEASFSRTPQGLLLTGSFSARTMLECVRCCKPFSQPLAWTMTELYAFGEKSVSESGLTVPEDAQIDLQPLVREYALLEVPIKPICKPYCRGLCPVCGQDLNIQDCGHRPQENKAPFFVLNKLL